MNIIVFRYSNLLHQPEPMRKDFAWWCKNSVFCPPTQREIGDIRFDTGHLSDVIARQTGLIVMSNGRATTQIPIACRLI
jgi:hypothetical protein